MNSCNSEMTLASWPGQNQIWQPWARFSKLFRLEVFKSDQSWIIQSVRVRLVLKHRSDLQLEEIQQFFWYLYWAFWKIHLLKTAASETSSEPSVPLFWSFFLNNSELQTWLTFVTWALLPLQYVTEAEGNLQRARALVDGMQKEKIELLNQLEEEKR